MAELNLYIKDLHDGRVFKYGEDCHDSLQVWDGVLNYGNLQNGDGSPTGYCFCNEDGSTHWLGEGAEYDEKYVHIGHVPVMQWISVKDRLPDVETEVLILADRHGRKIRTTAMYEDGTVYTEDSDWRWETYGFEYDEEKDDYLIPEGWWEYRHYNQDDAYDNPVDDVVTHWMPLPEPPEGE